MVKLEAVQENQIDAIITFLANFENEIRGKKFWKDRLNNWWNNNPSFNPNFKKGWILVNESENIVGFIGNIPTNYIINGKKKLLIMQLLGGY